MEIQNIHLYGGLDANVADSYKAKEFLETSKVPFTNLFYAEADQFKAVLGPVNSWVEPGAPPITGFPFLVWDEVEEGVSTRKVVCGLKAIKAANLKIAPPKPEK